MRMDIIAVIYRERGDEHGPENVHPDSIVHDYFSDEAYALRAVRGTLTATRIA